MFKVFKVKLIFLIILIRPLKERTKVLKLIFDGNAKTIYILSYFHKFRDKLKMLLILLGQHNSNLLISRNS